MNAEFTRLSSLGQIMDQYGRELIAGLLVLIVGLLALGILRRRC